MLARQEITERGTVPPERAIPVEPFFRELLRRGMTVRRREVELGPVDRSQKTQKTASNGHAADGEPGRPIRREKRNIRRAVLPAPGKPSRGRVRS
jgi:hypothetical protein